MYAGYTRENLHYVERFDSKELKKIFEAMLDDWCNEGFDPFAAPEETGDPYGAKHGSNTAALIRKRVVAKRMIGLPDDEILRTDANGYPLNRQSRDMPTNEPE